MIEDDAWEYPIGGPCGWMWRRAKEKKLAQDFNPNHEPAGSPDSTGGQFSPKESASSAEISIQNYFENKIHTEPPTQSTQKKGKEALTVTGESKNNLPFKTQSEEDEDNKYDEDLEFKFPDHMPPNGLKTLQNNMVIAYRRCQLSKDLSGSALENLYWFASMERTGGPWDYKQGHSELESFGNFHYGVVGTACGFPEELLLRAAGGYQVWSNRSPEDSGHVLSSCLSPIDKDSNNILDPMDKEKTKCAYGDDPKDQNEIKRGIIYARMLGYTQAG
ncbi:hypothetical protein FAI41_02510 [Acetobacteraceae bacterium]|nr:hypothetical protein FAI41_02510 [Acetobacteraceae bacterium]